MLTGMVLFSVGVNMPWKSAAAKLNEDVVEVGLVTKVVGLDSGGVFNVTEKFDGEWLPFAVDRPVLGLECSYPLTATLQRDVECRVVDAPLAVDPSLNGDVRVMGVEAISLQNHLASWDSFGEQCVAVDVRHAGAKQPFVALVVHHVPQSLQSAGLGVGLVANEGDLWRHGEGAGLPKPFHFAPRGEPDRHLHGVADCQKYGEQYGEGDRGYDTYTHGAKSSAAVARMNNTGHNSVAGVV